MDGGMAAGGPASALLEFGPMRHLADVNLASAHARALDLGVAPQAKIGIAVDQQLAIDGAVRTVANGAPFTQRFMLEHERLGLLPVTLRAVLIQPRHGQSGGGPENVGAVRIVALHTIHAAFENGMVLGQAELAVDVEVALEAGGGIFARVDDEFAAAATGLDMLAARAVAGFATALALEHGVLHVDARVRAGGKVPHVGGMTIDASLVADIMRARHDRRNEAVLGQAAARTEDEQSPQRDSAEGRERPDASLPGSGCSHRPRIASETVAAARPTCTAVFRGVGCYRFEFHRRRIQGCR